MNWLKKLLGCKEEELREELAQEREESYEARKLVHELESKVGQLERKLKVLKAYKARQKAKKR